MKTLSNKKIIVAVSGSIAAYKAAHLIRLLVKSGNEVRVIMTPAATRFISPLTLSTLSKSKVFVDIMADEEWNNHVELGLWADLMLIAPATATTLGKMASGIADNMLVASYLSAKCPVYIAPAMDLDMWHHPSTRNNIQQLISYGNILIPVGYGELASGLVGEGRMAEPEEIVEFISHNIYKSDQLKGKNVMITAGPTYEAIDPVRFIGNHSSGKMGIALAEECAMKSANVTLILGPTHLKPTNKSIHIINVRSAEEMFSAALDHYPDMDISIMAAAVSDYKPRKALTEKIKKTEEELNINLSRTPDIAKELGRIKKDHQINIGFALETNNELENALKKIDKKNFNFIVLNSLQDKGAGFKHDTNKIKIIFNRDEIKEFDLKQKKFSCQRHR